MSRAMDAVHYDQVYARLGFVPFRAPEPWPREAFAALDPGIAEAVAILNWHGIETCQSCQGGAGHCYAEPTIEFVGDAGAGMRAVGYAMMYGLPIAELQRVWKVMDGAIGECVWRLTFRDSVRASRPAPTSTDREVGHG